ncbi:MAG: hypothetical protein JJE34_09185 [Alphaproteobacteria bacterium]|nr:hypothetical protein [Alphaproteobacteria bacterium]
MGFPIGQASASIGSGDKLVVSEAAKTLISSAIQALDGYDYLEGFGVANIYEGAFDSQHLAIWS